MQAFKQGDYSRYCSVYSVLNSLLFSGVKLQYRKWQQLYDHLIYGINYFDALYEINTCGADYKRLEMIFEYAGEWLEENYKQKLVYHRPFWNEKLNLIEFIRYAKQQTSEGKIVHLRIKSRSIDHYTVIKRITKEKICFHDSSDLLDIPLKNINTDKSKKYQICLRQVYFLHLEPCKSSMPQMHRQKNVQSTSKTPSVTQM